MTIRLKAILFLMCWWAASAPGQSWVVYSPPEGDFRALFPAPPARRTEADGAVVFSAAAESVTFLVYRRDPRRQPVGNAATDIQRRLRGDDEQRVQRVGEDDGDASTAEYVFRTRNAVSIHRLFFAAGRYYELVVRASGHDLRDARATARDFFASFQMAGVAAAGGAAATVAPDVLCKDRSNAFSRAFCEYSTCLQSRHREQPYCQKLLRLN